jgi:alkanesulfonate monooxygenase SsuD/methylene tetrahydromethanopterin reductase-like flavin-dependent oxidoreductase (luciferase family)
LVRSYRDAYKAAGHQGSGEVYLRVPVYVAETEQQARDEPEASIMNFFRYIGERVTESATLAGARSIEERAERGQSLQTLNYDEARRDKMIVGTPASVIDRLMGLRESIGLDGILAELNPGGLIPQGRVMNALRLLCQEVMPHFK